MGTIKKGEIFNNPDPKPQLLKTILWTHEN